MLQVRDREGKVWKAACSGLREAKVLIPGDKFRVLGDDAHADDSGPSTSRLQESMPKECSAKTAAAVLRRHTQSF